MAARWPIAGPEAVDGAELRHWRAINGSGEAAADHGGSTRLWELRDMAETRICPMDESVAEVWLWFEKQNRLKDLLDRNDSLPSLTWLLDFCIHSTGLGEASCYAGQGTNTRQESRAGQGTNTRQESRAGQKRKQPSPMTTAKVPQLSSSALLTQEEQTELGSLKGDLDWEVTIFDTSLNSDFSTFGDLELVPPISSTSQALHLTAQRQNMEPPQQQQQQVLTEASQNNLDFEEPLMATSFLQHLWEEETSDYLCNCINIEQLFEFDDTSLPEDASKGSELTTLF